MCEYSRRLIAWMDGELAEGEAAEVERHLEGCAECRECVAAFEQASAGFEAYCDAVVGAAETRTKVAETAPRAEGASRRVLLSRLKPRPTNPAAAPFPDAAHLRGDVKLKATAGGLKPAATKAKRVAIGVGAIAAAAAIAVLLMLPRHRAVETPGQMRANVAAGEETLHAVQRPSEIEASPGREMMPPPAVAAKKVHRREAAGPIVTKQIQSEGAGGSDAASPVSAATEPPIEIAVPTENMFPPGAVPDGIGFTAVVTIAADDSAQRSAMRPRITGFSNGGRQP